MNALEKYKVDSEGIELEVEISIPQDEYVPVYKLSFPEYGLGTRALIENLKDMLIETTSLNTERMLDVEYLEKVKTKFKEKIDERLKKDLEIRPEQREQLKALLLQEMLGLGVLEFLLNDGNLEEVVINNAQEPVWVYHKTRGWLKTNVSIRSEEEIKNYASIIARRIGKQITHLNPLLDAHLITGDRANATLFPISSKGNTLTIRRFKRDPWTVTDLIKNNTVSPEVMALIWTAMQYEMNILFSGGTASGKTTFMNVCMPFIQPYHRVLTIEDTRELQLPKFLHWVPLTTREPNPEGKGEITMLDLLINSLRMRPDRVIVGEIRRRRESEVLFEAMHTGHSVYSTVHADTAQETVRRLINPPIELPSSMLDAVHLNIVLFRNRKLGVRRVFQVAELIPEKRGATEEIKTNLLYRWKPGSDELGKYSESIRFMSELELHTGLSTAEIRKEFELKEKILKYLVKNDIRSLEDIGAVMAQYYLDAEKLEKKAKIK